ncbi:MAG: 6-carboxytetrahydropterin synthase QueD [Rickettsiaceae bacterium]|nr:6-carboxytetrahydropterin synthase QueD [Rickettsiaceae bacterium]
MITCIKRVEFDAGHRVLGHKHKCKYLHGHRYALEVTVSSETLNEIGMVIDFADLKDIIASWINENFDHNVILHKEDKQLGDFISRQTGQNVYYLSVNPTAENIALHLKNVILLKLFEGRGFNITKVKLYETPNSYVEV